MRRSPGFNDRDGATPVLPGEIFVSEGTLWPCLADKKEKAKFKEEKKFKISF